MALTLHSHPFASFCQKVLTAFYENGTPFETVLVDLGDEASTAAFKALWPVGLMPVLVDEARGRTLPESTIIMEYLDRFYPGGTPLLPGDADAVLEVRLKDRFFDLYVQEPMQKIVADRLRPPGQRDPFGVAKARTRLATAYGMIEREMGTRTWTTGEAFTLADCAAAPALHYAELVQPFGDDHPNLIAYLAQLKARPSFARVQREAAPYAHFLPQDPDA